MKSDEEIRQTIRNNLKNLRRANDKAQLDVAKLTGKSENAVGSWEQVSYKQRISKGLQAGCHIGYHTCVIYRTAKQ